MSKTELFKKYATKELPGMPSMLGGVHFYKTLTEYEAELKEKIELTLKAYAKNRLHVGIDIEIQDILTIVDTTTLEEK